MLRKKIKKKKKRKNTFGHRTPFRELHGERRRDGHHCDHGEIVIFRQSSKMAVIVCKIIKNSKKKLEW